jgi:hypothetical protein
VTTSLCRAVLLYTVWLCLFYEVLDLINFDCDNTLHERRRTWIQNSRTCNRMLRYNVSYNYIGVYFNRYANTCTIQNGIISNNNNNNNNNAPITSYYSPSIKTLTIYPLVCFPCIWRSLTLSRPNDCRYLFHTKMHRPLLFQRHPPHFLYHLLLYGTAGKCNQGLTFSRFRNFVYRNSVRFLHRIT